MSTYYATMIIGTKDILKFLNSIWERGVKELSRWDRQSKKQDLRSCRAGHSITKRNSVSTEFMRRLQVGRWYTGLWSSISPNRNI